MVGKIIDGILREPTRLGQVLREIDKARSWIENKIRPFFRTQYQPADLRHRLDQPYLTTAAPPD
jgi:hypothetical protein